MNFWKIMFEITIVLFKKISYPLIASNPEQQLIYFLLHWRPIL